MGVVKRQGIKQSIVNYIATAIGMVNVLYIYPKFLEPAELGLFQFINNAAMLLVPFSLFGINGLVVKFFPAVQNPKKSHNNFLSLVLLLSLLSFALFFSVLYLNKGNLGSLFNGENEVILKYFGLIAVLVFLMQTNALISSYLLNFKKMVVPAMMNQLIKIVVPVAVLLRVYYDWSFSAITFSLLINYSIIFVILFSYLAYLGELKFGFDFSYFKGKITKDMRVYAGYGLLGGLGAVLATRIDVFMVGNLSTLEFTGIYVIGAAIANVIQIPITSINTITAPLISDAWHENRLDDIKSLYKKSSITLLIFSVVVFLLICISIDDLYDLMPKGNVYRQGKSVVLILGAAKLFDAATSVNSSILVYSKKFRFNLYFMLFLAALNTTLNVILIPKYNIMGAALATMISIICYNILKFVFIKYHYKLSPFTKQSWIILVVGVIGYGIGELLPLHLHPAINILLRSAIVGLFFLITTYRMKISEDFNDIVRKAFAKLNLNL
jgi:O-antigen/teichoic acid export membrane protein